MRQIMAVVPDLALRGHIQPAQDVQQRGLATARRAQDHHELAWIQYKVDAAQRVHLHLAHPVDLGQPAGAEHLCPCLVPCPICPHVGHAELPHRSMLPFGHCPSKDVRGQERQYRKRENSRTWRINDPRRDPALTRASGITASRQMPTPPEHINHEASEPLPELHLQQRRHRQQPPGGRPDDPSGLGRQRPHHRRGASVPH